MIQKTHWWNSSVGYIVFPSSFQDGNGDGLGDLPGLISRLDYLQWLGIDLVWICPIFASPMDDNGYDVSSYLDINPRFGSNEDFKTLLKEAHARGIKILVDLVLNHTSDEHPWFQKALKDPSSKERNYYFFRKGRYENGRLLPPNNWEGFFSTSTWKRVGETDDFYFHVFSEKMPDVNWSNPKLREEYYRIARYYLDLGVDGFRMDALAHLAKDETFVDSSVPLNDSGRAFDPSKYSNRPELYGFLKEFKKEVLDHYDCLSVGEVGGGVSAEESLLYSGYEGGAIDMVFNFDNSWCNGAFGSLDKGESAIRTNVMDLKNAFLKWHGVSYGKTDMPFYWCNHDHPRAMSQYGSTQYFKESGKMLFMVSLFVYGTPFIYQGDEIGMTNVVYDTPEDFFYDVGAKNEVPLLRERGYHDEQIVTYLRRCSRLNAKSPMQWDGSVEGGFSTGKPYLPLNPNRFEGVNVAAQKEDPDSILNFVKKAIAYRKNPEITDLVVKGDFRILEYENPDVLAFVHHLDGKTLTVIANMRGETVHFPWKGELKPSLHNYEDMVFDSPEVLRLRPFEALVIAGEER